MDKDFKHIVKINNKMTVDEIKQAEKFLQQYNPTLQIDYSTTRVSISGEGVNCTSFNFNVGIILINNQNKCACAIG